MRKQYIIENLDCAHCAMEMEKRAKKVPGALFVSINFLSKKLTLEAEDSHFQEVFRQVEKACLEIEPDGLFLEDKYKMSKGQKNELTEILLAVLLFIVAKILGEFELFREGTIWSIFSFLPSYLIAGYNILRKAILGLFRGRLFDENFLMFLATIGAFVIGEAGEGVMVMLLYRTGEFLQDLAVSKSRKNISELMDIRPDSTNLILENKTEPCRPEDVPVGSLILIKPGEKIPLDGTIISGNSFLDTAALTGESVPKEVLPGDNVISGCINMNGVLTVRTEKSFEESTVSKILRLIENEGESQSKAERFITRFARYYTPIVVFLSLFLALIPPLFSGEWFSWIHKAITCLVISCPCALVISVPLSFFGGIGCAGKQGILIKGADCLERLSNVSACAFDKTGTLTKGSFEVTAIHPEVICEEQLLELAATCENYSDHPISLSLKKAFRGEINQSRIGLIREEAGKGVKAEIDGKHYFVGNEELMAEAGISIVPCKRCNHFGTVVHVASESAYLGHIVVSDELRPDAKKTISDLKDLGVEKICLLSGDKESVAKSVGDTLGIQKIHASLLPQEKLTVLEQIQKENKSGSVIFVGDGMNDTPVLAKADLGVAMGGIGVDAAIEAADVVLIDDKPSKIALAIRIAKKTLRIVWQNIILSIGIKLCVLIPNIFLGEESVPIYLAIFADVGVCLIAILNAARALHIRENS